MAVVILHVHEYGKKVTREFTSGGLREKHVVNITLASSNNTLLMMVIKPKHVGAVLM